MIQSAIPHYKVDALLRRDDIDRYDDRENIRCNLIEMYDRLMAFVAKHLPDKFFLERDQRISLRDKIFREIASNILIHREYTNAYPSSLIIYKDKVESKNANRPHVYRQLFPDSFEPFPKNPHIAQIFTLMGRSEELGTGLRNVYKYTKDYSGSDNIQFLEEDIFITRVPLVPDVVDNVIDNVVDNVVDNENKIIELLKHNNRYSASKMASLLGLTSRTVQRYLSQLQQQKRIERFGSTRSGYWKIIKK